MHSEIWSTISNPDLTRLVTSSEDQTCRVWSLKTSCNPAMIKELKGHTHAVTSVDWKRLRDGREYMVSCSDDKTIRVYDP